MFWPIRNTLGYDFEHVGSGRLLLQRLPSFVEQPRVLDGNDGLVGESSHHFDLFRRVMCLPNLSKRGVANR